mmetsp:Transcript_26831/g.39705  ORF Transcript_26831/g.39705 Transcript_26831/m.39705 type:complete len:371 (-) Transcript_26831:2804-3916(-)
MDTETTQIDYLMLLNNIDKEGCLDLNSFLKNENRPQAGTKRKRLAGHSFDQIPVIKYDYLPSDNILQSLYSPLCVLHLSPSIQNDFSTGFSWKSLQSIFATLKSDVDSWCVETGETENSPMEFLQPNITNIEGYCSFMLQNDKSIWESALPKLPMQQLGNWSHSPCLWFFFGRNNNSRSNSKALKGRAEHTDSVSHDGTWHFQLSGTKRWFLRATQELKDTLERHGMVVDANKKIEVNCNQGDILIVNTRLWWHQTEIPRQEYPSVSYARDFYFDSNSICEATPMSNVDGLYATNDVDEGTIIFREDEMPDCALHRSSDPNCDVVLLDDETHAIISARKISTGEFFCIAESDDESGESNDGGEVDEDEDE